MLKEAFLEFLTYALCVAALVLLFSACSAPAPRQQRKYLVRHYLNGLGEYAVIYEADEVHDSGGCVRLYNTGDPGHSPSAILCGKVSVTRQ